MIKNIIGGAIYLGLWQRYLRVNKNIRTFFDYKLRKNSYVNLGCNSLASFIIFYSTATLSPLLSPYAYVMAGFAMACSVFINRKYPDFTDFLLADILSRTFTFITLADTVKEVRQGVQLAFYAALTVAVGFAVISQAKMLQKAESQLKKIKEKESIEYVESFKPKVSLSKKFKESFKFFSELLISFIFQILFPTKTNPNILGINLFFLANMGLIILNFAIAGNAALDVSSKIDQAYKELYKEKPVLLSNKGLSYYIKLVLFYDGLALRKSFLALLKADKSNPFLLKLLLVLTRAASAMFKTRNSIPPQLRRTIAVSGNLDQMGSSIPSVSASVSEMGSVPDGSVNHDFLISSPPGHTPTGSALSRSPMPVAQENMLPGQAASEKVAKLSNVLSVAVEGSGGEASVISAFCGEGAPIEVGMTSSPAGAFNHTRAACQRACQRTNTSKNSKG